MLKLTFIIFFNFFCNLLVSGQKKSSDLNSFIPAGYSILDSASGNLNKDAYIDLILILKDKCDCTTRPLILLAGTKNGAYSLIARNDSVVLCKDCGGIFGDPYEGIKIKKGFFSIEHYGGSSWRWSRIITFKYNAKVPGFFLHKDAGVSYHNTEDPIITTKVIRNKQDFGTLNFSKFSYSKTSGH